MQMLLESLQYKMSIFYALHTKLSGLLINCWTHTHNIDLRIQWKWIVSRSLGLVGAIYQWRTMKMFPNFNLFIYWVAKNTWTIKRVISRLPNNYCSRRIPQWGNKVMNYELRHCAHPEKTLNWWILILFWLKKVLSRKWNNRRGWQCDRGTARLHYLYILHAHEYVNILECGLF